MSDAAAWPGAWRAAFAGAEVAVGLTDAASDLLPAPDACDLRDAGARTGDRLALFLRRRAILRLMVGRRLGVDAAAVAIAYGPQGAPGVVVPGGGETFVSVSARGGIAAFALCGRPVGIDIERLHDPGPLDIALTERERAAVAAAPDRIVAALRHWTAKEAYLKAVGTGLLRDPAGIDVVADGRDGFVISDPERDGSGRGVWAAVSPGGVPMIVAVHVGTVTPPCRPAP